MPERKPTASFAAAQLSPRRVGAVDVIGFAPGTELTSATAMRFMTSVLKAIQSPYRVVIDCAGIAALDSAGLGAIVQLYKQVRSLGGDLKVASVPEGYARNIFLITRIDTILALYRDVDSAVAAYAGA